MTTWDKIYKEFLRGGEAWGSIAEDIHPVFLQFLKESDFKHKCAFDIGCGTGKYLKLLQALGFRTDGIDSSETSIEMCRGFHENDSAVQLADMYDYDIPMNKYDLIISIATIHHGTKEPIRTLIDKIYDALIEDGYIFITLPDIADIDHWGTFKERKEIEIL